MKKAIIISSILSIIILVNLYMSQPLNFIYDSSKYGKFYVSSSMERNKYFVKLESVKPVEGWRVRCIDSLKHNLTIDDVMPMLIPNHDSGKPMIPSICIKEDEPLTLTFHVDSDKTSLTEYLKMKKYFQQVFLNTEYYTLSMSPVFLQKNNEDYETVMKACKTLIY